MALEDNLTSPSDVWNLLSGNATAPENTAYGRIMLDVKNNEKKDGSYWQSTYIDNASVIGARHQQPALLLHQLPLQSPTGGYPESTLYTDT